VCNLFAGYCSATVFSIAASARTSLHDHFVELGVSKKRVLQMGGSREVSGGLFVCCKPRQSTATSAQLKSSSLRGLRSLGANN